MVAACWKYSDGLCSGAPAGSGLWAKHFFGDAGTKSRSEPGACVWCKRCRHYKQTLAECMLLGASCGSHALMYLRFACRNGGVGQRVLDVGMASNSHNEILDWMLKPGAVSRSSSRRTTTERSISGGGSRVTTGGMPGAGLAAPGSLRAPTGSFKRP